MGCDVEDRSTHAKGRIGVTTKSRSITAGDVGQPFNPAITGDAPANHAFYTQTLGLRLVKKTVNQDDVTAYHLFYADGRGSPGTDTHGKPIARVGDKATCPIKGHGGVTVIVSGVPRCSSTASRPPATATNRLVAPR